MVVVEISRLKTFYAGLFLSMAIIMLFPIVLLPVCRPSHDPLLGCTGSLAALLGVAVATILGHEAIHFAAASLLGVRGARLRFHPRYAALMLDYEYMTPKQYLLVAFAPQVLTPILFYLAYLYGGFLGLALCVAAGANLAGGAPDIVNGAYFYLAHGDARKFLLLYGSDGSIEGGVVEYDDKLVVYVMR